MKTKSLVLLALIMACIVGCKYDDDALWNKVNDLDNRVTSIENTLTQMNSDISAISTIVNALQDKVYVSSVDETENGYQITFTDGKKITITNGKDGVNGSNGKDAPVISIEEFEGKYYWVQIMGETKTWLTDKNGSKLPVTGADAITPILRVNASGYWIISYDRGITFKELLDENGNPVKAVGKDGEDGEDGSHGANGANGDSWFSSVKVENGELVLVLMDGTALKLKINDGGSASTDGIEALANFNPNEPIILDVSNDKGESVVMMGAKSASGHPEKLQQMIITIPDEENSTEILLDENENIKEMIAPNGVRFQFDWLSETEAALTLIDPNTNEQLNTVVDFQNSEGKSRAILSENDIAMPRKGNTKFTLEPIDASQINTPLTRAADGIIGNVYLEQCGIPTTAQCWVDVYDYSDLTGSFGRGRYRGRFPCTQVGEGHYQFKLPHNYNVHHNIADYCDAINSVVSKVCGLNAWTAPGSGAKQAMCIAISGALASGIVSVPVAAGFLTACTVTSVALDTACGLINGNMDLPEGAPNLMDGLCGLLREMDYTWDTPLVLQSVVNALPTCIYGTSQIYKADGVLKDMKVTWGEKPVINSFNLNPPAPAEGISYEAIARLYCLPVGTQVIMDIVGTDGYTDSQTTTITADSGMHYTATLYVPGAESGVKDVCTVTVITPEGETITKKASLVFQ